MTRRQQLILMGALLLVFLSAVFSAYSVHVSRAHVGKLSLLNREQAALEVEWEQLLLEINMLAGYNRIEAIAVKDLDMYMPNSEQQRVVKLNSSN